MVEPRSLRETSDLLIAGTEILAALLQEIGHKGFDLARLQPGRQIEHRGTAVEAPHAREVGFAVRRSWGGGGEVGLAVGCSRNAGRWILQPLRMQRRRHAEHGYDQSNDRTYVHHRFISSTLVL